MNDVHQDIQDLYADLSACLLTLANALEQNGAVSKQQIAECAQERLLAMQPSGEPDDYSPHAFLLLRFLALDLLKTPKR